MAKSSSNDGRPLNETVDRLLLVNFYEKTGSATRAKRAAERAAVAEEDALGAMAVGGCAFPVLAERYPRLIYALQMAGRHQEARGAFLAFVSAAQASAASGASGDRSVPRHLLIAQILLADHTDALAGLLPSGSEERRRCIAWQAHRERPMKLWALEIDFGLQASEESESWDHSMRNVTMDYILAYRLERYCADLERSR